MQLAYVLLICSLHMCIVHTFCTKAWHIIVRNLYANSLYATSLCFVYAFIARVHSAHIFAHKAWHIIACNLTQVAYMQFAYVLFMCILHICSMHINSTYAISEFTYVRSLQLCHAYARFAYMQHCS